ncbi:MAG: DUF6491 family protein [Lysobacterales bacterium]
MKKTSMIFAFLLPAYLAGCASQEEKVVIPLDNDPRIGEEVKQVCFTSSVRSWSDVDNDRHGIILVMNNRDEYKLKLTPGCDPQWAMSRMAIISRHGSCLSRGDRIKTDGDMAPRYAPGCTITRINKWDRDAAKKSKQQVEEAHTGK